VLFPSQPVRKYPAGHVTSCVHATHVASAEVFPGHWPSGRYDTPAWHLSGVRHLAHPASTVSAVPAPSHCRLLAWYDPAGQLTAHGEHCRSAVAEHWAF